MSNSIVTDPNEESSLLSSWSCLSLNYCLDFMLLDGDCNARGDRLDVGAFGIGGFLNNGDAYLSALFASLDVFGLKLVRPSL